MLTARDDELDKVLGLELGADDYITKPFSIREFRSRVRALLRRAATPHLGGRREDVIDRGDLRIDLPRRTVEVRGEPVQLTFVEFELLALLASNPGVVSRAGSCWSGSAAARTTASRARSTSTSGICARRSSRTRSEPELILTVRGAGYRFRDG